MAEFLSYDKIYNRIYPRRLRRGMTDEAFGALKKQAQNLDKVIYAMGQQILDGCLACEQTEQAQIFYKSLLRVSDSLLAENLCTHSWQNSFILSTIAINLAAFAARDDDNAAHVTEIFDVYEERGQAHLTNLEKKVLHARWKDGADATPYRVRQSDETAALVDDHSAFLTKYTAALFEAAARISEQTCVGTDIHQRAIDQLFQTGTYGVKEYQDVIVGKHGLCLEPQGFPGGLMIVVSAHDAFMEHAANNLRSPPKPLLLEEIQHRATDLVGLAAGMIKHFTGTPLLERRAVGLFKQYSDKLYEMNAQNAYEELKAIAKNYNEKPLNENIRRGLLKLHELIGDFTGGPIRAGRLFLKPHGTEACNLMAQTFKILEPYKFDYIN